MGKLNINGEFGWLTVLKEVESKTQGKRIRRFFECKCKCGNIISVRIDALTGGVTKSCGCYNRYMSSLNKQNVIHGLSKHPLYRIWKGLRGRCNNKNNPNYFRYGGRGIKVCKQWDNFINFYNWAISHGWKEGEDLEIDRRKNNLGYSPRNCRFVTSLVNNNNKRNNIKYLFNGEKLTLPQIARKTKISFPTLYRRINENGLNLQDAISIPLHGKCTNGYNKNRFLSESNVIEIFSSNESQGHLAKKFNIHESSIWRIRTGNSYKDITQKLILENI